jgi:prevent-host-death family protein
MISVGVRELKQRASELIQTVREKRGVVYITYRGKVVAKIMPVVQSDLGEESEDAWATLDQLAAEISASWPKEVSALEAVTEVRR